MTKDVMENEKVKGRILSRIPIGRFGLPGELDTILLCLASPHSSYINGAIIPVDGGWSAW
jgi:2-deoxy-D-gluconate 3-dehydrogenase